MPQTTKPRKVRCTCSRCGKIKYLLARDIDLGEEHFLCDSCDSKFIIWQNSGEGHIYIDDFLKTRKR